LVNKSFFEEGTENNNVGLSEKIGINEYNINGVAAIGFFIV
jgi:hypothetical protein